MLKLLCIHLRHTKSGNAAYFLLSAAMMDILDWMALVKDYSYLGR